MKGRGKIFELLDFPKFAAPSVLQIDAAMTSVQLVDRLGAKSFMSYRWIWSQLPEIVSGLATDKVDIYEETWKNETIGEVIQLLKKYFKGQGTWYPFSSKPVYVLGFWFKPSVKGIWFVDGQAYAVL